MVPNGWSVAQFGDLADFKSGGTPSKQNASYWGGEEPWISGKDLKSHYLYRSIDQLTTEGFHIAKKAPLGASLILVRGMTLLKDFPVGYATREVAFNQDIKALLAKANVDGLFLSFLLVGNKHKIKNLVTTAGHGTGRLDTDSLKEFPVDLPPLSEQRKIAKILSTWDKAIATTEKLIETSKQQKKALMQQLLTGKKRLVNPETGKAFEGEWEEVKLGELGQTFTGLSGKTKEDFGSGAKYIPYINIFNNSSVNTAKLEKVQVGGGEKQNTVQFGDVFFTTSSETPDEVGMSSVLLSEPEEPVYLNSFCFGFRPKDTTTLVPEFMQYLLRSSRVRRSISVLAQGATRYNLSKVQLLKINLLLPTSVEQKRIASVLTAADKEIEVLEAKLVHFKQEKKALMQQLLTGKRRVKVDEEMEAA
ncbi:restriction endonuclease subunit S [Vibrio parahaemolyticus]|nr:restriction endonuclease subunit S [Vibrio parahaemolyticus]EKL9849134.1 restriction endonuclease subunit S [Vibrio parahaemolyticus]